MTSTNYTYCTKLSSMSETLKRQNLAIIFVTRQNSERKSHITILWRQILSRKSRSWVQLYQNEIALIQVGHLCRKPLLLLYRPENFKECIIYFYNHGMIMIQSNDVLPHSFKADDANWPKQMFSHNVRNVLLALRNPKQSMYSSRYVDLDQ